MYTLKEEIAELKFVANETEQDIEAWAEGIDTKLAETDKKVASIRELLAKIYEKRGYNKLKLNKYNGQQTTKKEKKTIGPRTGEI